MLLVLVIVEDDDASEKVEEEGSTFGSAVMMFVYSVMSMREGLLRLDRMHDRNGDDVLLGVNCEPSLYVVAFSPNIGFASMLAFEDVPVPDHYTALPSTGGARRRGWRRVDT